MCSGCVQATGQAAGAHRADFEECASISELHSARAFGIHPPAIAASICSDKPPRLTPELFSPAPPPTLSASLSATERTRYLKKKVSAACRSSREREGEREH